MYLEYKVSLDCKYLNIKDILRSEFKISNRLLTKLKQAKQIYLNDETAYVTKEIKQGDIIKVNLSFDESSDNIIPTKMDLDILYEDESLVVLNKPSNTPIHPSQNHFEDTLSNGLQYYFNQNNINTLIRPIIRLDKDTSGIVLFAKNEYIQESLISQMKTKDFKKIYIALLEGHLENKTGTINAPIARKENSIIERCIDPSGDQSITHYKVLKEFDSYTLVEFNLETGRTHQIRVHSKYINHPILGDSLYGMKSNFISRQALHAYKISFIHPIKKELVEITAPIPDDINNLI